MPTQFTDQSLTADNARLYLACQDKRGVVPSPVLPAPAVYWDIDAETADVGRNVTFERLRTMRTGREEGLPSPSTVDAPFSFQTFLDKRHIGLHLAALLGEATTTDANSSGFIMFEEQPEDLDTIEINGITWTFVAAGPAGANETEIGTSLTATIMALAVDLNASGDADIGDATYLAGGHRLIITADVAGALGDAIPITAGTSPAYTSADTLRGGGLRKHVFESGKKALPLLSLVTDQTDMTTGPRYKAVHDIRYGTMSFALQNNGAARVTFTGIGVNEIELDADPVAGHLVAAEIDRFSHLQGGILIDDECVCGVVETGQIDYSNGLIAERSICCPGDKNGGAISGASPGSVDSTVGINARYYDPAITGKAEAGDAVKIVYQFYDPDDGSSLTFTFDQVLLPETTRNYAAGQRIIQNFQGIATKPDAGLTMRVELVNDVTGY